MAYTDQYALANDATFRQKIKVAAVYAAIQISSEAGTPTNRLDEKRHALAVAVLIDGGTSKLDAFAYGAACNNASGGGLTLQSIDSDIQFIINSIWNGLAGVSDADKKG